MVSHNKFTNETSTFELLIFRVMIKPIHFLYYFILAILSNNCQKDISSKKIINNSNTITTQNLHMESNIKITKIDAKKEIRNDSNFNQMTLFEVDNTITLEELKSYCSEIKPDYQDGYFQVLVFFKKTDAARFPDNPLTGMFMEDEDLKNIKATYTINNINGYSKLDYYNNNSFESLAQTIEIY